ncbi:DUF3556 domain-containing protein [Candidatus Binatia bacterium]|nr:DUF3556 domain-containing protein [Candidatus Binatia bacterium]
MNQPAAATDLPPFDPQRILNAPFPERVRLACVTWANASPNLPSVMALYWIKYFVPLIGGWAFWCSWNAGSPGFWSPGQWAFTAEAFKKAMVWSMFWELAGFGCGWGPMNARFDPWFGGCRHFLRTGTIKLPVFRGAPLIGGDTRNALDVIVYAANQLFLLRALLSPEVTPWLLAPVMLTIPAMGLLDKTLYLACRAEHYFVVLFCITFAYANDLWISGAKLVWCFIWFWAATSKLNRHFPTVIMFMMNNGPFFPKKLKKSLFRDFPTDLRASRFAAFMAHFGTAAEYAIPVILVLGAGNTVVTILGLVLMTGFHGFIGTNNPNGMPVEWNILMIYGGIFLFGFHPEAHLSALTQQPLLLTILLLSLAVVPTFGNFIPSKASFLLSMRYYAGNWAYNIWLVRKGGAAQKFDKLKKSAPLVYDQLAKLVPDPVQLEVAKTMMTVSRFMHFEGRALLEALPAAVESIEEYEWHEGELMGGMILGWNFGDGHLNGEQLLRAIQPICGFEAGEVRIVSVESQPLFGPTMHWRVIDAVDGVVAEGRTRLNDYLDVQPWPTGRAAEALSRGHRAAG